MSEFQQTYKPKMTRSQKRRSHPDYPRINETHPEGNRKFRRSEHKRLAAVQRSQTKIALRKARTKASKKRGGSLQTYLNKFYDAIGVARN